MSDETSRDCLHAILAGRVQGVGFRWYVQMAASRRGLTGTVRQITSTHLWEKLRKVSAIEY